VRRTLFKAERIDGVLVTADDPRHSRHEQARREAVERAGEIDEIAKAQAAAMRVRRELEAAKEGGYLNAWYSYINRSDIEKLLDRFPVSGK
jgi:hypothetical protein